MPKKKNKNLNKKSYELITGASVLIGEQHAEALLDLGLNIVLTDINEKKISLLKNKLIKKYKKNSILYFKMNITNENSIKSVMTYIQKKKYFVNILINNAAIDSKVKKGSRMDYAGSLESTRLDDWNKFINVNLTGAFLCSKIFGTHMAKKEVV